MRNVILTILLLSTYIAIKGSTSNIHLKKMDSVFHLHIINGNYTEAIQLTNRFKQTLNTSSKSINIGYYYYLQANLNKIEYKYDSSMIVSREALFYFKGDKYFEAKVHNLIGGIYLETSVYDSSLFYYQKALSTFKSLKKTTEATLVKSNLAAVYNNLELFEEAKTKFKEVIKYYRENNMPLQLHLALKNIGICYKESGEYKRALQIFYNCEAYFFKIQNKLALADIYQNIGTVFYLSKKNKEAQKYELKAIQISKKNAYIGTLINAYITISNTYSDKKQSINHLKKALVLTKAYNIKNKELFLLINLGVYHLNQNELVIAEDYLVNAKNINQNIKNHLISEAIYSNIGTIYFKKNNYLKALDYHYKALSIAKKNNIKEGILYNKKSIADCHKMMGNYKKAYEAFVNYKDYYDTLFNEKNNETIEELREKYETKKKNEEIKRQKAELYLISKENSLKNYQLLAVIFILFISILIISTLVYRNKLVLEKNKTHQLKIKSLAKQKKDALKKVQLHQELLERTKEKIKTSNTISNSVNSIQSEVQIPEILRKNIKSDQDWEDFFIHFEVIHANLLSKLTKHTPNLTGYDMRAIALIKLNFSLKESASILNITEEGVKKSRNRLKKKLKLEASDDLSSFINTFV